MVDSSVWIDYFRGADIVRAARLHAMLRAGPASS